MVDCMYGDGPSMVSPPRILVIGDNDMFKSEAMLHLAGLQDTNQLVIEHVYPLQLENDAPDLLTEEYTVKFEEEVQRRLTNCRALICRPTMRGKITELMVKDVKLPFCIATLSKGTNHIKIPKDKLRKIDDKNSEVKKITLIHAADENASAVAELAIQLANLLLRQVHRFAWSVNSRRFNNRISNGSRRLEGLTWLTVGAGAQVRYLLERLLNWRLQRFIIQTRSMNVARFKGFVEPILKHLNNNEEERVHELLGRIGDSMQLEIPTIAGSKMLLVGTNDLDGALQQSDIVSIHLPLELPSETDAPTLKLFNKERLGKMKEGAFLINVSRGDIVVEEDVLDAINDKHLSGYAADVLNGVAEESRDVKDSLLWQKVVLKHAEFNADLNSSSTEELDLSDYPNIILTPHVGGNTIDAVEHVAHSVVNRLLGELGMNQIVAQ